MSTGNMCIFYTFVPFYKFKMQYLYSFTKSFSIIDHAKAPIRVFLCYFSHYMVYQICFRNTYCVTDDIRYQGHKMFPTLMSKLLCGKHLVTRPDRSIKVGCNPTICDYRAGLWECAARNNPAGIKARARNEKTPELFMLRRFLIPVFMISLFSKPWFRAAPAVPAIQFSAGQVHSSGFS